MPNKEKINVKAMIMRYNCKKKTNIGIVKNKEKINEEKIILS